MRLASAPGRLKAGEGLAGAGWKRFSRNAFVTTKTLEKAIAPAASMGENSVPLIGIQRARGDRDQNDIVAEGPKQILGDVPHRRARDRHRCRNLGEIAGHQHDVRGFDRDVRAGADRKPDVGCGERRRVIDAIADEGELLCLAQAFHGRDLALGQHARDDLVDADLLRDRARRPLLIPGDHCDLHPELVQRRDRRGARGLHRIRDAEQQRDSAVDRRIKRRSSLFGELFRGFRESRGG